MAKIIAIGMPRNDAERQAIAYLRDHLPEDYTVIHNFELRQGKESFEIDLGILTPYCMYVVDVKGIRGHVNVYSAVWEPENRAPYSSPLGKGRMIARMFKAFIIDTNLAQPKIKGVYVRAAVLLTAPDVSIKDCSVKEDDKKNGKENNKESDDIVRLNECSSYFQNPANFPDGWSTTNIRPFLHLLEKTITSRARPTPTTLIYGNWRVEEELGGNERYTEYRAHHLSTGKLGTARMRVYRADPYQDEATRKLNQKIISNAFRTIIDIPGHSNILNVRDFIESEDGSYFVLVTEDAHGQSLRQHITKASHVLTLDQTLSIIRNVLTGLNHVHNHHVLHRNITPDAIIVGEDGSARLTSFDFARIETSGTKGITEDIKDDVDQFYQAPECYGALSKSSTASDLFSVGLVFYELLTGEAAFTGPTQIYETKAIFPVKPTEHKPNLPLGLNGWLQKLCAFKAEDRFPTAAAALENLDQAIMAPKAEDRFPTAAAALENLDQAIMAPQLDIRNLPIEYVLRDRFVIEERLGQGSFAITYKVFDTTAEVNRVLKLVLTDRISVYQRMSQEYKTLVSIPEHPYVVKIIWADRLPDGTPYMVFEYVDGKNVEDLVYEKASSHEKGLSVEDAVKLAIQVVQGLVHLHSHGVYHQDIKPSNLLWTNQGVRIIDFNVAVSDQDDYSTVGGTRHYIPPDLDGNLNMSSGQKIDRDIYALGITLYECVTGHYPFDTPNIRHAATNPTLFAGLEDLNPTFVELLLKAISPLSSDRFESTDAFLSALNALSTLRGPIIPPPTKNPIISRRLMLGLIVVGVSTTATIGGATFAFFMRRPQPVHKKLLTKSPLPQKLPTKSPLPLSTLYMTWRGIEGDQQIYWATLASSGWSHQQPIAGRATTSSPAIAYYQKKLYMTWKGVETGKTDDQGIYWATLDGSSWSHQQPIPGIGSASKPALITFQGNLYMVWRGVKVGKLDDQRIFWITFNGSSWTHQQSIPDRATTHSPALAVLESNYYSKLYMAWKGVKVGKKDDQGIYWATFDGSTWSSQQSIPGVGSASEPSLTTFQSKLYMAWRGTDRDQQIYWATFDGSTWSHQQRIPDIGTNDAPNLTTFQGKLYMAWRGIDRDQQIYWATFDGSTWSHQQRIPGRAAPHSPALAVLENTE